MDENTKPFRWTGILIFGVGLTLPYYFLYFKHLTSYAAKIKASEEDGSQIKVLMNCVLFNFIASIFITNQILF
jgi:hypothetical protein